jgi:hypothetical protein
VTDNDQSNNRISESSSPLKISIKEKKKKINQTTSKKSKEKVINKGKLPKK